MNTPSGFDFALENRLAGISPGLHRIFSDNVLCCQNILIKYKAFFASYTDHTSLHSLEVIAFCNELIRDNVRNLNGDEIFTLLMAAYLHDAGMGISEADYEEFSAGLPMVAGYRKNHPRETTAGVIRMFHHEFSGKFIEKYRGIFDFPSEAHVWAAIQVSRGHRKTDLYDPAEYPEELPLENGNVIRLPYLAALLRITDELDIAADRNIQFLYDFNDLDNELSRIEFKKHKAIKNVICSEASITAVVDFSEEQLRPCLIGEFEKLSRTLAQCVDVVSRRTPFELTQKQFIARDCVTDRIIFARSSV